MKTLKMMITLAMVGTLSACGNKSFDVGSEDNLFQQSNKVISVPIDILWVVDNSGSMATSQQLVANNAALFINKFKETKFDYRIAVTTTAAYRGLTLFGSDLAQSRFVDGTPATGYSGVKIITPTTPNVEAVFQQNILQGILGSADERSFQSIEGALTNPDNAAEFPRPGAYLAVIILTDEEDFSWQGTANIQLLPNGSPNVITDPRLDPVSRTVDFLDNLTMSTPDRRNYMVSSIAIFDETCRAQLSTGFSGRRVAQRHADLSDATGGVKASLCEDFSGILSKISDSILELSTKFYLSSVPKEGTLEIYVDNNLVPATGFEYNSTENSVTFKAPYIPGKDAVIRVRYTPTTLRE